MYIVRVYCVSSVYDDTVLLTVAFPLMLKLPVLSMLFQLLTSRSRNVQQDISIKTFVDYAQVVKFCAMFFHCYVMHNVLMIFINGKLF